MTALGYLRVSTDQQASSGLGLEAQRASLKLAAARLNVPLGAVYVDAGVSGSLPIADRPGLLEAVSQLTKGDVLLVAKRDRLGRDVIAVALIERLIAKRGARIVSAAGEGSDSDDPSNLLMRRLIDSFAEYERLLIGARTKAALQAKVKRGERLGTIPYGSQAIEGKLSHDAPEQATLARMRTLQHQGGSLRGIARSLNLEGYTTRKGTPWRFQYVAEMLGK